MLVIVAPGQGAQTPGFLAPWLDDPGLRGRGSTGSRRCAGLDLVHYGTQADADTIRDTAVAQPLLVAAGMLVARWRCFPHPADAFAQGRRRRGSQRRRDHSGRGRPRHHRRAGDGLRPRAGPRDGRRRRGHPTGMTAVLGGDADEVLATLEKHGLTPANINGAGQVVAAGTLEQLAAFEADPPPRARLVRSRSPARSTPSTWRPPSRPCGGYARAVSTHDPRTRLHLQPGRPGRPRRPRGARPASSTRWPTRSAGTCACRRWASSASPA